MAEIEQAEFLLFLWGLGLTLNHLDRQEQPFSGLDVLDKLRANLDTHVDARSSYEPHRASLHLMLETALGVYNRGGRFGQP